MKSTELMIGDLVYNTHNRQPEQVCEIRERMVMLAYNDLYDYDEIEPIPLTPEILENNGFYFGYTANEEELASNTIATLSKEDKGWVWDEGGGSVKVIFPNDGDDGLISIYGHDMDIEFGFIGQISIHELQHELRLCRISKEIVL